MFIAIYFLAPQDAIDSRVWVKNRYLNGIPVSKWEQRLKSAVRWFNFDRACPRRPVPRHSGWSSANAAPLAPTVARPGRAGHPPLASWWFLGRGGLKEVPVF